jgi:2-C-methyl-D-erythritol 4-phosphate cytidylyltransferase
MGGDQPKQFTLLGGQTLLERTLEPLSRERRIDRIVVVLAPGAHLPRPLPDPTRVEVVPIGGGSRAESVRNGLRLLATAASGSDFVLVHDAARPCLGAAELGSLIDRVASHAVGGLLALPVGDTIKRGVDGRVTQTVDRAGLWRATTPQMFRLSVLSAALEASVDPALVTDEASAVERLGLQPLLVVGEATNLKVTTPGDWALAEAILKMQNRW